MVGDLVELGLPNWRLLALCWRCASSPKRWLSVYGELRGMGLEMYDAGTGLKFEPPKTVPTGYAGRCDFKRLTKGVLVRDTNKNIQMELPYSSGLAIRRIRSNWWNVVHARSGKAIIAGAARLWHAERAGRKLAALIDWRSSEEWLFGRFTRSETLSLALSLIVLRTTTKKYANRSGSMAHRSREHSPKRPVKLIKGMSRARWEKQQARELVAEGEDECE